MPGLLRLGLEPLQVGAQPVDALPQQVGALARLRELGLDRAELARRLAGGSFGFARGPLGGLPRPPFGELVAVRRRRVGNAGQAPADGVRHVDRVEAGGLERPGETRGHDGGGGRGIHHRRIDGLLHVFARRRADRHAALPGEVDRLGREGRDECAPLAAEPGELRGIEVVLRFAERGGELERVAELALAGEEVHRPGGDRRLAQRLQPSGEVALGGGTGVALRGELLGRERVELDRDRIELLGRGVGGGHGPILTPDAAIPGRTRVRRG